MWQLCDQISMLPNVSNFCEVNVFPLDLRVESEEVKEKLCTFIHHTVKLYCEFLKTHNHSVNNHQIRFLIIIFCFIDLLGTLPSFLFL